MVAPVVEPQLTQAVHLLEMLLLLEQLLMEMMVIQLQVKIKVAVAVVLLRRQPINPAVLEDKII